MIKPLNITDAIKHDALKDSFDKLAERCLGPVKREDFAQCQLITSDPTYYAMMAHEVAFSTLKNESMTIEQAFTATNKKRALFLEPFKDLHMFLAKQDAQKAFHAAEHAVACVRRLLPAADARTGFTACVFGLEDVEFELLVHGDYDVIYGSCLIDFKFRKKDNPRMYWRQLAAYACLPSWNPALLRETLDAPEGITHVAWCNPITGRFEIREVL